MGLPSYGSNNHVDVLQDITNTVSQPTCCSINPQLFIDLCNSDHTVVLDSPTADDQFYMDNILNDTESCTNTTAGHTSIFDTYEFIGSPIKPAHTDIEPSIQQGRPSTLFTHIFNSLHIHTVCQQITTEYTVPYRRPCRNIQSTELYRNDSTGSIQLNLPHRLTRSIRQSLQDILPPPSEESIHTMFCVDLDNEMDYYLTTQRQHSNLTISMNTCMPTYFDRFATPAHSIDFLHCFNEYIQSDMELQRVVYTVKRKQSMITDTYNTITKSCYSNLDTIDTKSIDDSILLFPPKQLFVTPTTRHKLELRSTESHIRTKRQRCDPVPYGLNIESVLP